MLGLFIATALAIGASWFTFKDPRRLRAITLGFALAGLAGLMNLAVVLANHNHMPVLAPHGQILPTDTMHVELVGASRLKFLADIHGGKYVRYSLGDVVVSLGGLLVLGGCVRLLTLIRKDF
jgi:hypothetical protein